MNELTSIENNPRESKKSKRGGARPGAGRPRKTPEERLAATGCRQQRKQREENLPSEALGNFVTRVQHERNTFARRIIPDQTVACNFDNTAFSWPVSHALTIARDYATDVSAGKIIAGALVKLAAKRFLEDLTTGAARNLYI